MVNWSLKHDDPSQPYLVQLACLLCDESGEELQSASLIIRPEGFEIPPAASAIHGITQEIALACGVSARAAVSLFCGFARNALTLVAHNIAFDRFIITSQQIRTPSTAAAVLPFADRELFCTMAAATPLCKLPGKYDSYKWPKLIEAYRHFFNADFGDAHDALADVTATKDIYFEMRRLEKLASEPTPEVAP